MDFSSLERPLLVAIAGPNGAGKSTFYMTFLAKSGLPFVNADVIALEQSIGAYEAAELADKRRRELLAAKESFVFETVFSDPVGDKVDFLASADEQGYHVALCFIRIASSDQSEQRVSLRVNKGGHDVPTDRLKARFSRSLANLKQAIQRLPHVFIFDNSDLTKPYTKVALFEAGRLVDGLVPLPTWLKELLREV